MIGLDLPLLDAANPTLVLSAQLEIDPETDIPGMPVDRPVRGQDRGRRVRAARSPAADRAGR